MLSVWAEHGGRNNQHTDKCFALSRVHTTRLSESATRQAVHTTQLSDCGREHWVFTLQDSWETEMFPLRDPLRQEAWPTALPVIFNWNTERLDYRTQYLHIKLTLYLASYLNHLNSCTVCTLERGLCPLRSHVHVWSHWLQLFLCHYNLTDILQVWYAVLHLRLRARCRHDHSLSFWRYLTSVDKQINGSPQFQGGQLATFGCLKSCSVNKAWVFICLHWFREPE